jgi:uncharacterized membrane protein YkvA (DUF1232 family)
MNWIEALGGAVAALLLAYALLLLMLWRYARRHPGVVGLRDALRLLPDLLRLLRRLLADRSIGRGARVRVLLLLIYLASPIDLVPDFLPVIGYADDVIIVAWVLRSVVRAAGPDALARHWPGTAAGLHVMGRLAGLPGTRSGAHPSEDKR